jgi:CheY-like chemotaxis protein
VSKPIRISDPAPRPQRPRQRISLAGLKVLVAEDMEMVRDLITILLTREQASVTAVDNGQAALDAAAAQAFDIILMDMTMPIMGGFEATRRLRQSDGPNAHTPVVALTANTSKAEIAQCQRAGMDGHVAKPFTLEVLADAIADVLPDSE